jgi:hypothetical protein
MKRYIEENLAANFPRLWRIQIQWVTFASIVGFLLCLLLRGLFDPGVVSDLSLIGWIVALQVGFAFYWLIALLKIPTPEGIVRSLNSPSAATVILGILAVFAGPLLVFGNMLELPTKGSRSELPTVAAAEFLVILAMTRYGYATGAAARRTSGQRVAGMSIGLSALLFFVVVFCIILLFTLSFPGGMIAVGGLLVAAVVRVAFCFRVRRRAAHDMVWFNLLFIAPAFMLPGLLAGTKDLLSSLTFGHWTLSATALDDGGAESPAYWLALLLVLVTVVIWIDLVCFMVARFAQLPRRGR